MKKYTIFAFTFSLLSQSVLAENLYRITDDAGHVTYITADHAPAGAELIEADVKPAQSETVQEESEESASNEETTNAEDNDTQDKEKQETHYDHLTIIAPGDNSAIRENAGNVVVKVDLSPKLDTRSKHELVYTLDGMEIRSSKPEVTFMNISRGLHTVQVRIVDRHDKTLKESQTVRFQLHRFSRLFK
ncbi:MAG: hypothetical protein D6698_10610 [Gammaproteobacteria bacterium]|nr:MAG: hypothetical protein D6698_10610 [Gammaproteobacteria bacterium]